VSNTGQVLVSESASLDAAAVVSANRTTRNAISNYAYYGLQALILLALQAYIIRSLGKEHYSIWPVLRSCINIAGLIQIGLGAGASRFIAVAIGHRDGRKIERLVGTYLLATFIGATAFWIASFVVALNLERLFNVPEAFVVEARWAMVVMGLSGAVQMVAGVFAGILTATQSFVKLNILRSTMLLVRTCVVLTSFAVFGPDLVWVAVSHLVVSFAEAIGCILLSRKVLPWLKVTLGGATWATFREVNSFSLLTLVTAIAARLYWDTDNVLINRAIDPTLVAGYAIVTLILLRCSTLTSLASNAVSAPLAVLYGQGQLKRIAQAIYRANHIAVPIGAFFIIFMMLFGEEFIDFYAGSEYREYASLFPLIGMGFLVSATQNLPSRIPAVFGKVGLPAAVTISCALLNVVLSLVFVCWFEWGLMGVAGGTVAVQLLYRATFFPVFVAHLLEEPVSLFFWRTVIIPLAACLPVAGVLSVLKLLQLGESTIGLLFCGVSGGMVHLLFILGVGVDSVDRCKVREQVWRIIRRRGGISA
jgi:O-antigen/teichoic acid export membrane protein